MTVCIQIDEFCGKNAGFVVKMLDFVLNTMISMETDRDEMAANAKLRKERKKKADANAALNWRGSQISQPAPKGLAPGKKKRTSGGRGVHAAQSTPGAISIEKS